MACTFQETRIISPQNALLLKVLIGKCTQHSFFLNDSSLVEVPNALPLCQLWEL